MKVTGADQYAVWDTDSNGNFVSLALNTVSGTSAALQSIETSFQQDLNGDGSIGSAGAGSSPHFVFEGVDSSGAQVYDAGLASVRRSSADPGPSVYHFPT